MINTTFIRDINHIPKAADEIRAQGALESWLKTAESSDNKETQGFAKDLAEDPSGRRLLEAIFGNSPFLSKCLLAEMDFFCRLIRSDPDQAFGELTGEMEAALNPQTSLPDMMATLRRGKRQTSLLVAVADICNIWNLAEVTGALSLFAEITLGLSLRYLFQQAAAQGDFVLPEGKSLEKDSGYFVLGLGKLGGRELNYSSDIDIIVFYDSEKSAKFYKGKKSLADFMVRLTQNLIRLMDERTADGYVFRTDVRLRPDPGSTPVAIPVIAAETYYEGAGQNWERAALIKARVVAGDTASADSFLHYLTPFLWRKSLDFASIADIHSIKRQINAFRGQDESSSPVHEGLNLKLAPGGIREIEFFAQTQQLIWGGREPALRIAPTCKALDALVTSGHLETEARDLLVDAYAFLRHAEHRLQMVNDAQTHSLPTSDEGIEALAVFLGYSDAKTFLGELEIHLENVRRLYGALFKESAPLGGPGNLVFTGAEDDPETLSTLTGMGFKDPSNIAAVVRKWHHGRYAATRSERARQILTELMPALLTALAGTADPDGALLRLDDFLSRLPAGVQLFSLFHSNPGLLDLLSEIMGSAPRLADRLARRPILLDGVLSAGFNDPLPDAKGLSKELEKALEMAESFEDSLDICRRWAKDRKFQLGVNILHNTLDAETASANFTDIGDVLLASLQPRVEDVFARTYGHFPGDGMCVIAMGKLGSHELTVASDLDLIFVYADAPEDALSDGKKAMSANVYFARLGQRFINALSAHTSEGELYEVDMRLRPSGTAGPIASSLTAFTRYQSESAWVWEHMALTRARVVTGTPALRRTVDEAIAQILTTPRNPDALVAEIADMRQRIVKSFSTDNIWELKYIRGGVIDIEFLAQYLQLRYAPQNPDILDPNTIVSLTRLGQAGLLDASKAQTLCQAARLWHRIQGLVRLCFKSELDETAVSPGLRRALATAGEAEDFDSLKAKMLETAAQVLEIFDELITIPAAKIGQGVYDPSQITNPAHPDYKP